MRDPLDGLLSNDVMVRLRAILEDRSDAVLSLTAPDLTVLWAAERGAEEIYRRTPEEYEGASTRDFVHPRDLERWEKSVTHALTGAATGFEGRALAGTGEWVRVRSYLWPTWDRDAVVGITVAADGR